MFRRIEVAEIGTPEEVARIKESYTGRFLKNLLARQNRNKGAGKRQAAE